MKNELSRKINVISCGAHIVHNCIQTTFDVIPIKVEALVIKMHKYFHICVKIILNNFENSQK